MLTYSFFTNSFQLIWDHDVFGMKDFLGSVTLSSDDIRRYSSLDSPQWLQLQGTKSGCVEIKVKVISEMETEVRKITYLDVFR